MIREASSMTEAKGIRFAKLLLAAAVSALLCAGMLLVPAAGGAKAFADENAGEYTYTITVYAGEGTINGGSEIIVDGILYGKGATLVINNDRADGSATLTAGGETYEVKPADDRYFVKGLRKAGANETDLARPADTVTQNEQYVVAYGLMQDRVGYRAEYLDETGKPLAESQAFYGNVGDKPVVAFKYIEGYVPNAYNITGTLSANEADNVFQFIYRPVEPGETVVRYVNRGTVLNVGPEAAMEGIAEGQAADGDAAAAGEGGEPAEIIDLDDDETPLASGALEGSPVPGSEKGAGIVSPALVAALFGVGALLVILAVLLRKFSRKEK